MEESIQHFVHLKPSGRICLGEKLINFQEISANSLESPHPRIILDMTGVTYIDSSGIGEILKLFLESRNKAKKLILVNLSPSVMKIMTNAKLDSVFTIAENLEKAIKL